MSVELPKDHEGREIPLDTEVLYDNNGVKFNVDEFRLCALPSSRTSFWTIRGVFEDEEEKCNFLPHLLHLAQPDSWKRLLDDLDEAGDARYYEACAYFHRDKDEDGCISCPGGEDGCARIAMRDIAFRIRKLRGENDG